MIKNYFLIAIRNISKRGLFSVINIAGLAIGLACSILIFMWVYHELSYDRFHPGYKNIQRMAFRINAFGEVFEGPVAMAPVASVLLETFPEVDDVVRINREDNANLGVGTEHFTEPMVLFADSSFFSFFGFALETGNPETVLEKPFSMVITRELADKFFGNRNPVGEIIKLNNNHEYTITGVAANLPSNSHLKFGAVASFVTLYETNRPGSMDGWLSLSYYTYIRFNSNYNEPEFFARLDALFEERFGEKASELGISLEPYLQPIASIYLNSNTQFELTPSGNKAGVQIFFAVAVFILLLACINFMNLSTARASQRSKEVGVRKVIGASRGNMIMQFLGESVTYTLVALLVAIPLIELGLPYFNNLTGVKLSFIGSSDFRLLAALPVFVIVVGLIAGSYPAFVLSMYDPLKTIKGEFRASSGNSWLRGGLGIFQMVISIALIICTIFVWQQLEYINSKELGFDKHNKLIIHLNTRDLRDKRNILEKEFMPVPGVKQVAFSNSYPGVLFNGTVYRPEGSDEEIAGSYIDVDHGYIGLMGIKLAAGRNFDPAYSTDSLAVLVNQAAVRHFGWTDPLERTIDCKQTGEYVTHTVIGVIDDFHFRSMHQEVEPLMIHLLRRPPSYMTIDTEQGDLHLTIARIRDKWEELNPYDPFGFKMLSESYDVHYRAEKQLSRIFTFFSFLAFIIAALGLYGLSSFMVESKTKEIGIKKVFGAPVSRIVLQFLRQFGIWLIIANIIAWALAWYYMDHWLSMFAYKVSVNNPLVFMLSALVSVLVVLIAAGYQSLKAAYINPARSLRYE
jgi:putative ABC transport system permease protein